MVKSATGIPTDKLHNEISIKSPAEYLIFARASRQSWKATYDLTLEQ